MATSNGPGAFRSAVLQIFERDLKMTVGLEGEEYAVAELRGRDLIETRYGPLGSGGQRITIADVSYSLAELMSRMGLNFDDSRPIDVLKLPAGCYVLRYYDGQDQRVVGQEFDTDFNLLVEVRAHIAEWLGEEAYFSLFSGH